MALASYRLGDTVLLAFIVVNMSDPNNVVLEMSNGDRHHFSDAQIKLAGIEPNPSGTIVQDTTISVSPSPGDVPPGQSVLNPM